MSGGVKLAVIAFYFIFSIHPSIFYWTRNCPCYLWAKGGDTTRRSRPGHIPRYMEPTSHPEPSWLLPLVFHIYFLSQSTWLRASVQTRIDYLDRLSTEAKEGAFIHLFKRPAARFE